MSIRKNPVVALAVGGEKRKIYEKIVDNNRNNIHVTVIPERGEQGRRNICNTNG